MSNCITSAPYYSICCLNECDKIYQNLEATIPASKASPAEIIKAVENMPQGAAISASLRTKLDEVAEIHSGNVPLHGRLVAQWLHFAFPNECPYPHATGTISPKTPAEWRTERGDEADSVSEDEVKQIMEIDAGFQNASPEQSLKGSWTPTESLLMASTPSDESDRVWSQRIRIIVQVCMMISCVAVVLSQLNHVIHPDKKKAVEYDI